MRQEVTFKDLFLMEYGEAWKYQEELLLQNTSIKSDAAKNDTALERI